MRQVLVLVIGAALALAALSTSVARDKTPRALNTLLILPSPYRDTRPVRRDIPLREQNISDFEVVQIEAAMKALYPGSIVYISAITTGCPCEDGPNCTDLVWTVATSGNNSRGIALSNIDGKWQVGPLQQWWLDNDRLWAAFRSSRTRENRPGVISFNEHRERIMQHNGRFPQCSETMRREDIRLGARHTD